MTVLRLRYTIHLDSAIFSELQLCGLRPPVKPPPSIVIHVVPQTLGFSTASRVNTSSACPACSVIIQSSWQAEWTIMPCFVFIPDSRPICRATKQGPQLVCWSGFSLDHSPKSQVGNLRPEHSRPHAPRLCIAGEGEEAEVERRGPGICIGPGQQMWPSWSIWAKVMIKGSWPLNRQSCLPSLGLQSIRHSPD